MTSVYIHCPMLPTEAYCAVLEKLCPATVRNATIHIHAKRFCRKQLQKLMDAQKEFGMARPIRFRNILVLDSLPLLTKPVRRTLSKNNISVHLQTDSAAAPKLRRPVRKLAKHGISCKLWVDENDQMAAYRAFQACQLPINLQRPIYDENTVSWFDSWLYDPHGQAVNTFCDIIAMLTLQTASPNCRYASCFGTTYCVDDRLQVYLCPHRMDSRTLLGGLDTPDKLLQCDTVAQLLTEAIGKRSHCAQVCDGFAVCQGGCLLESSTQAQCRHYTATVAHIRACLLDVYHNGKLGQVNPIVKNAILNALAFGTAFFNLPPANQ